MKINKPTTKDFQFGFEQTSLFEKALTETFGDAFTGIISSAFASYTELYLKSQELKFTKLINAAFRANDWIDPEIKVYKSAIELIRMMGSSIEKASAFTTGNALFDLFFILKDNIKNYCERLQQALPQKLTENDDLKKILIISNTLYYFCSIIEGLAVRVSKKVSDDQKPLVRVDDTKDQLADYSVASLKTLSKVLNEQLKPEFEAIATGAWQNQQKRAPFVKSFCKKFDAWFKYAKTWSCEENFAALSIHFVPDFTGNLFNAIYSKNVAVTAHGLELLSLASEALKSSLVTNLVSPSDKMAAMRKKWIAERFGLIDDSITVMMAEGEGMVLMYLSKFKEPTRDKFAQMVRCKEGLSADGKAKSLLDMFDAELKKMQK